MTNDLEKATGILCRLMPNQPSFPVRALFFATSTQVFWHQAMISLMDCFERLHG
ncbi:hypothetical protein [[Phormidium] sp. ETS-05]|uniref:hypothetical protein n=1 Tax=[Phormidium] sp. ETS-05 TaxID=222819 RepID=UPI0018EEDE17|nr:hypothetical protein [[Phormidium] sp. ETS-05]